MADGTAVAARGRAGGVLLHGVLAALAYIPPLLTGGGLLNADTKQYLYLAPGRLLARAPHLWDPSAGLGSVTHQNIGYLWPMGPFFWVFEQLGVPDWVAQRLWYGTVLFAAGAGVVFLLRVLRLRGVAPSAAALVYMFSPFVFGYLTGTSVILLPFAGLPWLLGLTVLAVRRGGWLHPALVALVVTTVGGVNASSLFFVAIAPTLWLPFAAWVTREAEARRVVAAALRIVGLTLVTQVWWVAALVVGGEYGLPVLRVTETLEHVAATSSAPEVLRGLGYWFFYGGDNLGQWLGPSNPYTQAPWLLAASFAVPLVAFAAATATRWRHRAYFVTLALVGTVVAVGPHPLDSPSPLGGLFRDAAHDSDLVLSLRNTQRAVPLVALASAVLTAGLLSALARRHRRRALVASAAVAVLAGVNLAPFWTGDVVAERFHRPEEIPDHWREAAAWLDAGDHRTRVLELPGSDFGAFRWGNTLDPLTPGLTDRSVVSRELVPVGSPPGVSLVNALDRRMQEGTFEPASLAPVARLLGAGHVLFRFDLEYERYRTPRPWVLWESLRPRPPGFAPPVTFGEPVPNRAAPEAPLVDEITLATVPGQVDPPPIVVFPLRDPLPVVRARPVDRPVVLAGDGEGVVEAAAAGLVDGRRALLYSASAYSASVTGEGAPEGEHVERRAPAGAVLVLTDTNRRAARRWFTLRENAGYTEQVGEEPLERDPTDARLPPFPEAGDDASTVAVSLGGMRVRATGYGNPVSLVPDDRPSLAADGDLRTDWLVGGFSEAIGERIVFEYDEPVTADRVTLVQPQDRPLNRWITSVSLRLDGGEPLAVELGPASRTPEGQVVGFPRASFSRLDIEITGTDLGRRRSYRGVTGVGFAEVSVADRVVDEALRLPTDLLAGIPAPLDHPLAVVLARQRTDPAEPVRTDPEPAMARVFELPSGRAFGVTGTARLSALAPDELIDRLVGLPPAEGGGVTARSSGRLPGDLAARASSALDGDPDTRWSPGFLAQRGHWIEVGVPEPITVDHLDLAVLADGRHSVPTRLRVDSDGGDGRTIELPAVEDRAEPGATVETPVSFEPLTGSTFRFTVEDVREVRTPDWYSDARIEMPVGIAELGIPGVRAGRPAAAVATGCRDDLLTVDGRPVPVAVEGGTAAALGRDGLRVRACGDGLDLEAGHHVVRTRPGRESGIDLDRLVLASAAGGAPAGAPLDQALDEPPAPPARVESVDRGRTSFRARVRVGGDPFWFVLGQSHNRGWSATVDGRSLGDPVVVDGFANGWRVDPEGAGVIEMALEWRPQRLAWAGLAVSAAGVLACVALVAAALVRRLRTGRGRAAGEPPTGPGGTGEELPSLVRRADILGPAPATRPPAGRATLVGVAAGLGAAAVSTPIVGVVVAALTVAALRLRRPLPVLGAAAVAALGLSGAFVVVGQVLRSPAPDATWPEAFHDVHWVAFSAPILLAAHVGVDRLRRISSRGSTSSPAR